MPPGTQIPRPGMPVPPVPGPASAQRLPISSPSCDKHVRGNLTRQLRRVTADSVLTCHSHTVIADHERYLASGLYPDVLEFKHQCRVALYLFADPAHHNGRGEARSD